MKIELIRQRFNETRGYKYRPFTHCCDKVKENPRIVFSDEVKLDVNNLDDCLDDECTFPAFAIWHSETVGNVHSSSKQSSKLFTSNLTSSLNTIRGFSLTLSQQ